MQVAELRILEPLIPVCICLRPRDPLLHRLADLAVAGADRIVVLDGPDTNEDLRRHVREALKHTLPAELDLGVRPVLGDRGSAVVLWCARNGYLRITESMVASRFCVDRSTILKAVKRSGWDHVQQLIRLARLLHVAVEFERSSVTSIAVIAGSLHFTSADALHKHVQRATGRAPSDLRFAGAQQIALDCWRNRSRER